MVCAVTNVIVYHIDGAIRFHSSFACLKKIFRIRHLHIPVFDNCRGGVMKSAFICVYLRLNKNSGSTAKTVNGYEN